MLSVTKIAAEYALSYYDIVTREKAKELSSSSSDYYSRKPGEWYGKGARLLNLEGAVTKKHFENAINGKSKGGKQLISAGVNGKRRSGWDWTFSMPKSVSVMAELLTDDQLRARIYDEHENAVRKTLDYFEKNYAVARITHRSTQVVPTGNLVFALFTESTSRSNDPNGHTHVVIMNMTRRSDGNWRAFGNDRTAAHPVFAFKMFMGQIYRNFLAKGIQQNFGLGVMVRPGGLFELEGFPGEIIQHFSTRSQEIKTSLEDVRNEFPWKTETQLKEIAALRTRGKKVSIHPSELRPIWLERMQALGYRCKDVLSLLREPVLQQQANSIDLALKTLTVQESVLRKEDILKTALQFTIGSKNIAGVEIEMKSSRSLRELGKNLYTSSEMQGIEKSVADLVSGEIVPAGKDFQSKQSARRINATLGQENAIKSILEGQEQVILIQGDAGTGKTKMLGSVSKTLERVGRRVVAVAPTARAAAELSENGISATTIERFFKYRADCNFDLLVVDEASMVGSRRLYKILSELDSKQKLAIVGDVKQMQAIEAGGIFGSLQRRKLASVSEMSDNVRQKTEHLRRAVELLNQGQADMALAHLDNQGAVHEIKERQELFASAAETYLKSGVDTLGVVESNYDKDAMNELVRKKMGLGSGTKLKTLQSKSIMGAELNFAHSYEPGDRVFASDWIDGLKPGCSADVVSSDQGKNRITVKVPRIEDIATFDLVASPPIRQDKVERYEYKTIDVSKHGHNLSCFRTLEREFAAGESVMFLKNDNHHGIQNSLKAKLDFIETGRYLHVTTERGQKIRIDSDRYPYLDYGYFCTDYKVQGMTADNVVYVANLKNSTDFHSAYTAITRARKNIEIFTSDKGVLIERAQIERFKLSTLDIPEKEI